MLEEIRKFSLNCFHDSELLFVLFTMLCIAGLSWWIYRRMKPRFNDKTWCLCRGSDPSLYPSMPFLHRRDVRVSFREIVTLAAVTLCYAVISFHLLGSHVMPHTCWQPSDTPQSVILELEEGAVYDQILTFFTEGDNNARLSGYQFGLNEFQIEGSHDAKDWYYITSITDSRFAQYTRTDGNFDYRYIRLTSTFDQDVLTEIAFRDISGNRLVPVSVYEDAWAESRYPATLMIDEQDAVRINAIYYDEAFFDEVYHPRNAAEIASGQYMYATVHPLLGTQMIALSIRLFGMNPFGWRFAGALIGVLLIPVFWFLLKLLFETEFPAMLGAFCFACDFMHITTSRIATLEPMSVFFINLMFLFLLYWCRTSFFTSPLKKSLLVLFGAGVMTGLGVSVKWTACYSAVGLALLYACSMWERFRIAQKIRRTAGSPAEGTVLTSEEQTAVKRAEEFPVLAMKTILWSVLFFLVIPAVIYALSYIPCHFTRDGWSIRAVIDQAKGMYSYHTGLDATHPFQSVWYQWILDIRPIWYYSGNSADAYHTIACFTNPILSIAGLAGILYCIYIAVTKRSVSAIAVVIGYLTAIGPWFLVDRCVFAYHFYPTSFFMIASIACLFEAFRGKNSTKIRFAFAAAVLLLFLIYLPALTGFGTDREYIHLLEVIPSWSFG
ncbi:MAG: phospholipid carrier-dependent glycosyltransferase [Solobacterium sp.]|nr:phospholipid carrier-dependent glycosyltransferase [Solobacterium sp.]